MRIAFITNEFVIEKPDAGGLGNYLYRITKLLKARGYDIEIFVTRHKTDTPRVIDFNGIRVEHIPIAKNWYFRIIRFFDKYLLKTPYSGLHYNLAVPLSLSRAMEKRHRFLPFEIVQSSNVSCAGLFIKRRKNRKHFLRLSSIVKDNLKFDNQYNGIGARILVLLEYLILLRATRVYAPCQFTIDNYKLPFNKKIYLVRPPFILDKSNKPELSIIKPAKYLIHFGSIGHLKGSDMIARALVKVWEIVPDFTMVWVGKERFAGVMDEYKKLWRDQKEMIIWIDGLKKNELYSMIKDATASVLPSRFDNLPNTVIESLFLNVPVIGSKGASIDELVIHMKNGVLVEIENIDQLAQYMIDAWLDITRLLPNGFHEVPEIEPLRESNAVRILIDFFNK